MSNILWGAWAIVCAISQNIFVSSAPIIQRVAFWREKNTNYFGNRYCGDKKECYLCIPNRQERETKTEKTKRKSRDIVPL